MDWTYNICIQTVMESSKEAENGNTQTTRNLKLKYSTSVNVLQLITYVYQCNMSKCQSRLLLSFVAF